MPLRVRRDTTRVLHMLHLTCCHGETIVADSNDKSKAGGGGWRGYRVGLKSHVVPAVGATRDFSNVKGVPVCPTPPLLISLGWI